MRKLDRKLSKKLQKSLSHVFCRIKSQTPNLRIGSTTSRLLNGCRYQHSLPIGRRIRRRKGNRSEESDSETAGPDSPAIGGQAATLEDIDRFLFENFRSLFSDEFDTDREAAETEETEETEEEGLMESPLTYGSSPRVFGTPDLTSSELYGSESSVTDSVARSEEAAGAAGSTITASSAAKYACLKADLARGPLSVSLLGGEEEKRLTSEDCIAVLKASEDPAEDFRRSMRQVMEARARHGEVVDWEFMEEMLFCCLKLNDKKYYRFVLDAFVDSVVDLRRSSCDSGGGSTEGDAAGREKGKEMKNG